MNHTFIENLMSATLICDGTIYLKKQQKLQFLQCILGEAVHSLKRHYGWSLLPARWVTDGAEFQAQEHPKSKILSHEMPSELCPNQP